MLWQSGSRLPSNRGLLHCATGITGMDSNGEGFGCKHSFAASRRDAPE
jgi:hypothetical protein